MWILRILLVNLAMVFLIELIPGAIMCRRDPRKTATIALANVITNPPVVLISMFITVFFGEWIIWATVIIEILAVLIEGAIYRKFEVFKRAYLVSFVLNLASYTAGEIIQYFL